MVYKLEKEFWISCSHKLEQKLLSPEKNKEIYGKCNNEDFHGHNYKIILKLKANHLDATGMIMNFNEIKKIFKEKIDDKYDHHCLNSFKEFQEVPATAENMCKIFYNILKEHMCELYAIKIYETEGASAEYEEKEEYDDIVEIAQTVVDNTLEDMEDRIIDNVKEQIDDKDNNDDIKESLKNLCLKNNGKDYITKDELFHEVK